MSTEELELTLDPVTYEIFYNRLLLVLNEAREVVRNTSASPIVKEAGEVSQVVCSLDGEAVLLSPGLLIHVRSITRAIRHMLNENYGEDVCFYDGDQFINNDPHIGGAHIPDMVVVAPYFYKGKHIGWLGNYTHVPEVGAIDPGGTVARAEEFYHEGICLPCLKIVERGVMRRDIFNMMARAVRDPRGIEIDTRAKIAGNERARKKLTELIDEFGLDLYMTATQQMVKDAETQAQEMIKTFRPGIYRSRLFLDGLTPFEEGLRVMELALEITEEGELKFNVPVVSRQTRGFNNAAMPCVEGETFCVLLSQIFYKLRWNGGMLRRISFSIPENSMLNADKTAAVGYSPIGVVMMFMSAINEALSRASFIIGRYENILAPCSFLNGLIFGGIDQFGRPCGNIVGDSMSTGGGARYHRDGADSCVCQFNPWNDIGDIEANEASGPLLEFSRRYVPDSGGFGKYRGGLGAQSIITPVNTPFFVMGTLGIGGHISGLQGIYGAYPPPRKVLKILYNSDLYQKVKAKETICHSIDELEEKLKGNCEKLFPSIPVRPLAAGDVLGFEFWGGAGLGDPIERDPKLIIKDIEDNLTYERTVRDVYCAAINPETLDIDYSKTEELRSAKKKERLSKGIPARKYIARMVEKRRNRDLPAPVLKFFDDMTQFSPGLVEECKYEEEFIKQKEEKPVECKPEKEVLSLTPYVKIVEDSESGKAAICSICGHCYCEASKNFKLYCLIYDRDPEEIQGEKGPEKDWMIYREFYCPGCGIQVEVEATPPGLPILYSIELEELRNG